MHIVELSIENFKRIRAISIEPDDSSAVVISGRNAQGKTSVLDAIWAALGGREGNKSVKPIRDGADQARVTLNLGDMIVTRIWRNGTTAVKVQSADGAEYKSPQSLLDTLFGRMSFDPLAFTRLSARDQKEMLLKQVTLDVDIDKLDAERETKFAERTEVGRTKKALGEPPAIDPAIAHEETSAREVLGQLEEAMQHNQSVRSAIEAKEKLVHRIEQLEKELDQLKGWLGDAEENATTQLVDEDELRSRLQALDEVNVAIRSNNAAREQSVKHAELEIEYADLSEQIAAIDAEKAEALARAEFPVDGLGFDADGVTFAGIPFSQASAAEQIRVSMAMAMASNPKLRVIRIMDGSLLDDDGMRIITDSAREHGFQVWIERVADGGAAFVIEDGELQEVADAVA
ncbi:AAA family ATPase [Leucobacter sp. NPDC058333]|uniref:AAA family ATPase n=1 Tax=Leucobacter sp. NPDC058333 TaxID=3346450 RepID=UPI0036564D0C